MKKGTMFYAPFKVIMVLVCAGLCYVHGFSQGNAAQPQPIKKTSAASNITNTANTTPAPWEVQRVQPNKSKAAGSTMKPNTKPEQAQPIKVK